MTPLRGSHQPLSSTDTSSPIEEDLAQVSAWDDTSTLVSTKSKGKGKQRADDNDDDEDGDDDNTTVNGDSAHRQTGKYPPIPEETFESRKVEENLKRWEMLEKQRRKQARESRSSGKTDSRVPSSSSFSLGDVSRRASQLWHSRGRERPKSRADRTHPHQVLEDVEESVHMDGDGSPSIVDTPRTSTADTPRTSSADTFTASPENPFENPQYAEISQESSSIMTPTSSTSLTTPAESVEGNILSRQAIRQATHFVTRNQPPPMPLGLPQPTSPPPPSGTTPQRRRSEMAEEVEAAGKRWWTEWLCGCREDGDDQAGRTNPME